MWHRIRKHENTTAGDLALYSQTVTATIHQAFEDLFNVKYPWSKE
jgi:hypothetical protein